jgi:hypothetical protein
MTNGDPALGMVGTAMTLMFGIAMIDYAQRSTKDLMKSGRGKNKKEPPTFGNMKFAPDFRQQKKGSFF